MDRIWAVRGARKYEMTDSLFLRIDVDHSQEIWISEVSRTTFEANEIDDLGTDYGYFLLIGSKRRGGRGARILAKCASEWAARELFMILTKESAAKGISDGNRKRA